MSTPDFDSGIKIEPVDWVEEVLPKVKPTRKLSKNRRLFSWYRNEKSAPHKTIKGRGLIARLRGER